MVEPNAPTLAHPALHKIPRQIRFGLAGLLSNILFMLWYNAAVHRLGHVYAASTIYSVAYFWFLPLSHALTCILVFGWPHGRYLQSLGSNYPIGLTAIALGAACTAHLDRMDFHARAENFLGEHVGRWLGPASAGNTTTTTTTTTNAEETGELYSSLVVLVLTSVWSYVLSMAVNTNTNTAPSSKATTTLPLKKEL